LIVSEFGSGRRSDGDRLAILSLNDTKVATEPEERPHRRLGYAYRNFKRLIEPRQSLLAEHDGGVLAAGICQCVETRWG